MDRPVRGKARERCVWLGNRKVFRALSVTDSFDCRVVRTWNEQRDGDYVRRGEAEEIADQMKMTSRVPGLQKGLGP